MSWKIRVRPLEKIGIGTAGVLLVGSFPACARDDVDETLCVGEANLVATSWLLLKSGLWNLWSVVANLASARKSTVNFSCDTKKNGGK